MKLMDYQRLISHSERVTRQPGGGSGLAVGTAEATTFLTASAAMKVSLAPAELCQESIF